MANYKELEGFGVQTLATDPDSAGWVGSIFYNSTEGVFKTVKPGGSATLGTWASGGDLNTARGDAGMSGVYDAAFIVGGNTPTLTANHEQYNGSSWTEVADLNTARYGNGATGTTSAGLTFAGQDTANLSVTESWNGSSWSEINDLSSVRSQTTGTGTSTDSLIAGGWTGTAVAAATEEWNVPTTNNTLTAS